jgi:hypothetical protein
MLVMITSTVAETAWTIAEIVSGRHLTVTGDHVRGTADHLAYCQAELTALYHTYLAEPAPVSTPSPVAAAPAAVALADHALREKMLAANPRAARLWAGALAAGSRRTRP